MKLKTIEKCLAASLPAIPSADEILDQGVAASTYSLQVGKSCFETPRTIGGRADLPVCRAGCPFHKVMQATII